MDVTRKALYEVARLRRNGFTVETFNIHTCELGILAIADKGNEILFVYPNGSLQDMSPKHPEEIDDEESYEDWVRGEYNQAVGA